MLPQKETKIKGDKKREKERERREQKRKKREMKDVPKMLLAKMLKIIDLLAEMLKI